MGKTGVDDELDRVGNKSDKKKSPKISHGKELKDSTDEIPILCAYEKDGQLIIESPNAEWLNWWRGPDESRFTSRRAHIKMMADRMPSVMIPIASFCQDTEELAIHVLYTFEQHIPGSARLSEALITIGDEKKCKTFPYTSLISKENRNKEEDKKRRKKKQPKIPEGLGYAPFLEV